MITSPSSLFRLWARRALLLAVLTTLGLSSSGCRGLMKRGPVPDAVAASRSLSAQGLTALNGGDWQQAELLFEQAIEACPTDVTARREYAELLWQRGKADAALAQIDKAGLLDPEEAEIHVRAGSMYLTMGKTEPALQIMVGNQ